MYNEILSVDGKDFYIEYDNILTSEQRTSIIEQIKSIFFISYNQTNQTANNIQNLAVPREPPQNIYNISYLQQLDNSPPNITDIKKLENKKVSVILPCRNEGNMILDTVNSILNTKTNIPYNIIVVDDGSTDNCCNVIRQNLKDNKFPVNKVKLITNSTSTGACKSRNIGAVNSDGDYICFCDAHIIPDEYWLDKMVIDEMSNDNNAIITPGIADSTNPEACGYGATLNLKEINTGFKPLWIAKPSKVTEVPFSLGGCMLMSKQLFNNIGGFDEGFQVWGNEDMELSLRAWLLGYKVLTTPNTKINHIFRPKHPYKVLQENVDFNNLRIAIAHFKPERIEKILKTFKGRTDIEKIMSHILTSDIFEQRNCKYASMKKHNDDWFFNKFSIEF